MSKALYYRADIDGLRGIAIIGVVLYHGGFVTTGGYVGVDVFFVISGFLITNLIVRELDEDRFSIADFLERRARRILPALCVMVATMLLAGYFLFLPPDFRNLAVSAIALIASAANIRFWQVAGYFQPEADENPLLHTWSLSLEEQFYIIVPLALWVLSWLKLRKWLPIVIGFFCATSFVLSVIGVHLSPTATFYLLPTRAWELAVGSLLAVTAEPIISNTVKRVLVGIGMLMILVPFFIYTEETLFPGIAALPPVLGAAMIIAAGTGVADTTFPSRIQRILSSRLLVGAGLISYSVYLWHWPLLSINRYVDQWQDSISVRAVLVFTSVLIGWCSWRFIERPFRSRNSIGSRKVVFAISTLALFSILAPALAIWRSQGLPNRLGQRGQKYAATTFDSRYVNETLISDIPDRFVKLGAHHTPPTVFLWGDSHAMAIMPAIEAVCLEHRLSGLAATHSSTAPVLDWFKVTKFGLNEKAIDYHRALVEFLDSPIAKQTLKVIVLAAYWEAYVEPKSSNEEFQNAILRTAQRLRNIGYHVVLFDQVPIWSCKVPRALALQELIGWESLKVSLENKSPTDSNAGLQKVFGNRLSLLSGTDILNPRPYFLDTHGRVLAADVEGALFRDNQHLTTRGALRLKPAFDKLLYRLKR